MASSSSANIGRNALCTWCNSSQTCQNSTDVLCNQCETLDLDTCCSDEYPGCSWIKGSEDETCIYDCDTRSSLNPDAFFSTYILPTQVDGSVTHIDVDDEGSMVVSDISFSFVDSYIVGFSNGPFVAKISPSGNLICSYSFDSTTGHANGVNYDGTNSLFYVVGDGKNIPLEMDNAPAGLQNTISPRTQDAAILAFSSTNCSLVWSIGWGSSSNQETFNSIASVPGKYRHHFLKKQSDYYRIVSGTVTDSFPILSSCASPFSAAKRSARDVYLSESSDSALLYGLILIFDATTDWNLLYCAVFGNCTDIFLHILTLKAWSSHQLSSPLAVQSSSPVMVAGVGKYDSGTNIDCFYWLLVGTADSEWSLSAGNIGSSVN